LYLSKHICYVFELIPNIKAHVDRRGLLSRHRDTITGPRINLDDLLLFQFVLCTEDKSRKIGVSLEIVDDYFFDFCVEGSQDVREKIMRERLPLFRSLLEVRSPNQHSDQRTSRKPFLVAKKHRAATARLS
jgi:hypothetical protein